MKQPISAESLLRGESPDFRKVKYAKVHAINPPKPAVGSGSIRTGRTSMRGGRSQ